MNTREIESKVRELRQLQALIDEAQAEAEAIKDSIKAAMGDSEALRVGEYFLSPGNPSPPPGSTPARSKRPCRMWWRRSQGKSLPAAFALHKESPLHHPPRRLQEAKHQPPRGGR